MKLFVTGIATLATVLVAQGCSSVVQSKQPSVAPSGQPEASPMAGMDHGNASIHSSEHSGMEMPEIAETAQAKLTAPQRITPNTPAHVVIDVQDKSSGKPITNFDLFQTKLMHLIVVSDNLQAFSHIHPIYQNKGRFDVEANFPQPGGYTLFSDYKPTGQKEQVSVMKTQVLGISPVASPINLSQTRTFGNTKASLTFPEVTLKAGQEIPLTFDLQDKLNNQPINDLQPYLGEKGHLVIVRQAPSLSKSDYIHAHAAKDPSNSRAQFMTSFPKPGRYKLWGQFNRNGKIVIADFWVNVSS